MAGQDRGGNEGCSGTAMWKVQQQMGAYRAKAEEDLLKQRAQQAQKFGSTEPSLPPNVLVDGVALGGASSGDKKQKPLVRHVLVKDLQKVAQKAKYELPTLGIFKDKAALGLYAIFDGQSCAGSPGPAAAEFCARSFHTKVLYNLARLGPDQANEIFVKAALIKSFEDLDMDLLTNQPEITDGCGAAVCLLIGEVMFTAVLGKCEALLCEATEGLDGVEHQPLQLGMRQGRPELPEEQTFLLKAAGATVVGQGGAAQVQHPRLSDCFSPVSRSLGDRVWKATAGHPGVLSCSPEVQGLSLRGHEAHPLMMLANVPVMVAMSPTELVDLAVNEFNMQPRACCGEIATRALEAHTGASASAQCTAVMVCFLPPRDGERRPGAAGPEAAPPLSKRQKVDAAPGGRTKSVRLRHILVKFHEAGERVEVSQGGKKALRSRQEAESQLRRAIKELRKELADARADPKQAKEFKDFNKDIQVVTKKFIEICREMSDCDTALKGGGVCGDLGWVTPESGEKKYGINFRSVMDLLRPGQWSDIVQSDLGLHLVQRIA